MDTCLYWADDDSTFWSVTRNGLAEHRCDNNICNGLYGNFYIEEL